MEPAAIDHKFYARGVGFIQSVSLRGGRERLELVATLQTKCNRNGVGRCRRSDHLKTERKIVQSGTG
jgi:hypothetical protein